ncbi:MerR family transcriptional regulator [Fusibacter paucivorans]|uniref:MerR family transcriptional regulator n=1 Tax=Fusibacter paucivorans TaxID=76009 RepID=A0ABS5PTK9_9FIRM|nr:MerR family transcriptional regulator [Fusibacter paucivorans]MBS7528505.1 MerR family transcriptional regulator [Fusibacter paucivorans]
MYYRIGEIEKKMQISIDTLRYYEKIGLICPERDTNNRRLYSGADVAWLEFIFRLKQTHMPLKEIKKYAELRKQGDETIAKRIDLLEEQRTRLTQEKMTIDACLSYLETKIAHYKTDLIKKECSQSE